MRTFEVHKVELLKMSHINVPGSTFKGQIWLEMVVRGAAHDEDFCKKGSVFPMGENGRPTFRPSVGWYLDKFEFCNAEGSMKLLDHLVRNEGDDVFLTARWEGTFFERYELHDFPFDLQALTMSLSINCRTTGPIPASFLTTPQSNTVVSSDEQLLGDAWHLKTRSLLLRTHLVGYDADRLFPTLSISSVVQRKSHFFVYNAALPFAFFSLLSLAQFALRLRVRGDASDAGGVIILDEDGNISPSSLYNLYGNVNHRSQMTLMLVLTAAACEYFRIRTCAPCVDLSLMWLKMLRAAHFESRLRQTRWRWAGACQ